MFQLKLEPPAVVKFFHDPAKVVLALVFESSFCMNSLPLYIFACQQRGTFRILSWFFAVFCCCSCLGFFHWGLLVMALVDSQPKGTERIWGMLGSVGCQIYQATPITIRYVRWMDPTPPMLISAVHSWCVCAMGVLCVSQLLPLPLPTHHYHFFPPWKKVKYP